MTYTTTSTYTKTDIRRVFECFHADLSMLAIRTGAMDQSNVEKIAHDVFIFAEYRCLNAVHIQLRDSRGHLVSAHEYKPNESIFGGGSRPGGNSWPYEPNGKLVVILSYSNSDEAERVKTRQSLLCTWSPTDLSTDYSRMRTLEARQYTSSGYGLERTTYAY